MSRCRPRRRSLFDGLQFIADVRYNKTLPWRVSDEPSAGEYATVELVRLTISSGLAVAAGQSGQVVGALGALAIGAAAPLLIKQLAGQVSLTDSKAEQPATSIEPPGQPPTETDIQTPTRQEP